ncbi:MAG: type I methionyl aminopeptidase [Candidatus Nealsonbacteria bacterium CG09_land_8_20_14_0_10_42_14]|uniref:Methionine aminopeptidase n=1 Tax=Candidatus Nealsonbacteria bacterium CG09_land_8_20_14_0_10_42_14 TaxID=1974707 RepID=A0A2H0WXG4_9BACT|nr:MAG: type I methionyl aminopeptidase [Candidatus Nealsonbacteria bacterium CG09_land_8_20_14_0_10_42_14]
MKITIKTKEEIETMREGGKILARIMKELEKIVKPGICTKELDRVAETLILKSGGKCSFKGYQNFPACLCTSINEEIVHGIPSERILKEGEIISLDLGIFYQGFHADMAVTLPVGEISPEVRKLIEVTKEALKKGIEKVRPGSTFDDVGFAIQKYVASQGFKAVRDLCGHGIGRKLHEDPQILNFIEERSGEEIKEGMTFCLEPMATAGDWRIKQSRNKQTWETADGSLSAHFEHTILVNKTSHQILTE